MITERTLRQWRKESLMKKGSPLYIKTGEEVNVAVLYETELHERILRLTQELLDQHLLRKG